MAGVDPVGPDPDDGRARALGGLPQGRRRRWETSCSNVKGRGLSRLGGARRQPSQVRSGGDPRPRGAGRRGQDGAGRRALRAHARRLRGSILLDGKAVDGPARPARGGGELGIAYVPEDRRGGTGWSLEMSVAANATLATLRAGLDARPDRVRRRERESSPPCYVDRSSGIKAASLDAPVGQPLGGEPAEGGAGPVARGGAEGPDPRRADAGGGRRGQGRDPSVDGRAGGQGAGDRDDLVRATRDPGDERPGRRDARGTIVGTLDRAEATQEAILELEPWPKRGWPHDGQVSPGTLGRGGTYGVVLACSRASRAPTSSSREPLRCVRGRQQRLGAGGGGGDDAGDPVQADRHLGGISVQPSARWWPGCWRGRGCRCRSVGLGDVAGGCGTGGDQRRRWSLDWGCLRSW